VPLHRVAVLTRDKPVEPGADARKLRAEVAGLRSVHADHCRPLGTPYVVRKAVLKDTGTDGWSAHPGEAL
jgi:hypothetical protein